MKIKKLSVAFAFMLLAISISPFKSVLADGEKNVSLTSMPAWEVAATWDNSAGGSSWVNQGAKVVLTGGVADAWNRTGNILKSNTYRPIFNIANNRVVSFEFKIGLFDNLGNIISKSNNSSALDIHIMNAANDLELSLLRIWTDSGGALNGNHSFRILPYADDWNHPVDSGPWIKGDATLSSSFFVQFSKANWFESYVGGSDQLTRLDNGDTLKNNYANRFDGIDEIYFRIGGDNGFTTNTEIIVTSINGQSLANDGVNFVDTVAPLLIETAPNATIPGNVEYTLPITGYDLFANNVSYEIYEGTNKISNSRSFTPKLAGNLDLTLKIFDGVGNHSEKQYSFEVTYDSKAYAFAMQVMHGRGNFEQGTCPEVLTDLEGMYGELSALEQDEFDTNQDQVFVDARNRMTYLSNWVAKQSDHGLDQLGNLRSQETNSFSISIVFGLIVLTTLAGFCFLRKKRN